MMSLRAKMELTRLKPCAFCGWATHAFPNDTEHNQKHDSEGWHTCGLDGIFRQYSPNCDMFMIAPGSQSSF